MQGHSTPAHRGMHHANRLTGVRLTDLASSFPAFDIHYAVVALVEPAEVDASEAPDPVADFLEPDGEVPEEVGDEDARGL